MAQLGIGIVNVDALTSGSESLKQSVYTERSDDTDDLSRLTTITVNSIADPGNGTCDAAECTLREAIAAAAPGDTIVFGSPVFDSIQKITLTSGQLLIDKDLTINGTGASRLTISANRQGRVLEVSAGVVTIRGITFTEGRVSAGSNPNGSGPARGGGILNLANLTLIESTITNNETLGGTGGPNGRPWGGGIYSSGSLSLMRSTVSYNLSFSELLPQNPPAGGGIYAAGTVVINGSTVSHNEVSRWSAAGGGIYNSGQTTILNSTISDNRNQGLRGGSSGGAIFNAGGATLTVRSSTIVNNTSRSGPFDSGGISNIGTLQMGNTIIARNSAPNNSPPNIRGTVESLGHNLIGNTNGTTIIGDTTGNILNQDPQLGSLANNGGPTQTYAPLPDSPILDAGSNLLAVDENGNPLATDQRGGAVVRISGPSTDIGSYEKSLAEVSVSEFHGADIPDGGTFDFGVTTTLNPITKLFTVRNDSSSTLGLGQVSVPAGFTLLSNLPSVLPPNTSATFQVRLNATEQGAPSGTLSFETNDEDENPFNFTITGTVGAPPTTAVASITPLSTTQNCTPLDIGFRVIFTQPINGVNLENFVAVDINNTLVDERPVVLIDEGNSSYVVYVKVQNSSGQLRLDVVNRNGTNAIITNLPFAGPTVSVFSSPLRPSIEPVTPLPVQPNSTGNQLTASEDDLAYTWFLTAGGGTITSSNQVQTITFTAGNQGDMTFFLLVGSGNGCTASTTFVVPVALVTDPVVTNNNDSGPGSLRQAIFEARAGSTITFANNVRGTITLTSSELLIEKNLTIRGPGANRLAISGNDQRRVIHTALSANVTIEGLTITDGLATSQSPQGANGGAILNRGGTLAIKDSVVSSSTADGGGAIMNFLSSARLTVIGSTLTGNSARVGGAFVEVGQSSSFLNSTISGNSATESGGGMWIDFTSQRTVNIVNATVANNTAVNSGGGVFVRPDTFGVGIATVNSLNSLFAQNALTGPNPNAGPDISGRLISFGNNLIGRTAGTDITGDTTGNIIDPVGGARLSPLGSYGGGTLTHALLSSSPAINMGNSCVVSSSCVGPLLATLPTDQRGAARVGVVDIGAMEFNTPQNGGTYLAYPNSSSQGMPYAFTLTSCNAGFTYAVTSGALPNGLSLSSSLAPQSTVTLVGIPTQTGTFDFAITATNGVDSIVTNYRLNVLGPTSGTASISGRLITNGGLGLRNAFVVLALPNGTSKITKSSNFGYYRFDDVPTGQTVIIEVRSKQYTFSPMTIAVTSDIANADIVGSLASTN